MDLTQTHATTGTRPSITSTPSSHPEEGRFLPGTLLNGRYRIIGMLGRGGMGEVYRATDLTLGQSVALKFLSGAADQTWLERFHNEVRIARQVSHPNVCRVYDIGEAEGLAFLSMEYVDGEDLATLLRRIGRLPNDKALEISRKVCAGLAAAHSRGVIHRDLKPGNIMLDRRGEVLIVDFGLAALPSQLGPQDVRQGTPAYMAPEQLKGSEVSAASDIYALGLVLYELFTGKRAYEANNVNALLNQQEAMELTSMTSIANDVDPAVEKVIRRCLDPTPGLRPANPLSVSASLPGGDPLAAALAAGETPSPELVAAGKSVALPLRYSAPLLAFILIFLIATPIVRGPSLASYYSPLDMPPEALRYRSREVAKLLGYPQKPLDSIGSVVLRDAYLKNLAKRVKQQDWRSYFAGDSPFLYRYREGLNILLPMPIGFPDPRNPTFEDPGMLRLDMDSAGHLRSFQAVPGPGIPSPKTAPEPSFLFQLVGFDFSRFAPCEATRTPLLAFDELKCFSGPHPTIPDTPVTVQYATWKGHLTELKTYYPWTPAPVPPAPRVQELPDTLRQIFNIVALLVFAFWAIVLAHRNLSRGKADKAGALRFAVIGFCLNGLNWIGFAHFVPSAAMVSAFTNNSSFWLFYAGMMWLMYIAVEPTLRARWPQSIITWNRALAGRWGDTQVNGHVLMGIGLGLMLAIPIYARLAAAKMRESSFDSEGLDWTGPLSWLGSTASRGQNALFSAFLLFFILFGLKVLLRKEWLAAIGAALFMTIQSSGSFSSTNPMADAAIVAIVGCLICFALLRFGLLTALVAVFVLNSITNVSLSTNLTTWFAPYDLATLLLIGGLACWAFFQSLGSQRLVGDDQ
jgi:serine/threonine protein kinase